MFAGKSVLVTGGTGSLGSALIRHLLSLDDAPRRVICFSRDELKQSELAQSIDDPRLRCFLGDVRDVERLSLAFRDVAYVVHAAALKQVPALEFNPTEAVRTNILGSMNVLLAALGSAVEKVLLISTDKAVSAVNLYGATKAVAERVFIAGNAYRGLMPRPRFSVLRYGNVAGSRGSVIPLWRARKREQLPLFLTHAETTRFWVTLPQAVGLVVRALKEAEGGEVFIPKLPSVRMLDVARVLRDGAEPRVIGLRPGEKIHEALLSPDEQGIRDLGWCYATGAGTRGTPVDAFAYTSNSNSSWLTGDELREAVQGV